MKYDVFISYSTKDKKVVEGLCAYLEQHKIRCFVAYRDVDKTAVCRERDRRQSADIGRSQSPTEGSHARSMGG